MLHCVFRERKGKKIIKCSPFHHPLALVREFSLETEYMEVFVMIPGSCGWCGEEKEEEEEDEKGDESWLLVHTPILNQVCAASSETSPFINS